MKIGVISSLQSISVLCSKPLQQLPSKTRAAAGVGALRGLISTRGCGEDRGAQTSIRGQKRLSGVVHPREKRVCRKGMFYRKAPRERSAQQPRPKAFQLLRFVSARCCLSTSSGV